MRIGASSSRITLTEVAQGASRPPPRACISSAGAWFSKKPTNRSDDEAGGALRCPPAAGQLQRNNETVRPPTRTPHRRKAIARGNAVHSEGCRAFSGLRARHHHHKKTRFDEHRARRRRTTYQRERELK